MNFSGWLVEKRESNRAKKAIRQRARDIEREKKDIEKQYASFSREEQDLRRLGQLERKKEELMELRNRIKDLKKLGEVDSGLEWIQKEVIRILVAMVKEEMEQKREERRVRNIKATRLEVYPLITEDFKKLEEEINRLRLALGQGSNGGQPISALCINVMKREDPIMVHLIAAVDNEMALQHIAYCIYCIDRAVKAIKEGKGDYRERSYEMDVYLKKALRELDKKDAQPIRVKS